MSNKNNEGCMVWVCLFVVIIQAIIIVIKMFNIIDWEWWIVLMPIEIFLGIGAFFAIVILGYIAFKGEP